MCRWRTEGLWIQVLLKAIMLRRTKDATIGMLLDASLSCPALTAPVSDGKPILNLPGRFINIIQCSLDGSEREFYDALEKKQTLAFNKVSDLPLAAARPLLTTAFAVPQAGYHHGQLYFSFDTSIASTTM